MKETNWDELAEEYTQRDFPMNDWIYGYLPVLELLSTLEGKNILDYGCGSGKFSRVLAAQGANVIAVDPTEKMLALGKNQDCHNIMYRIIVDNNISFIDLIDFAVATYVLCTRQKDEEIIVILKQIYDKLVDNGSLVILEPHPNNRQGVIGIPLEINLEKMSKPVFDYPRSVEKYVSLLEKSGFVIEKILEPKNEQEKSQMLLIKALKCTH